MRIVATLVAEIGILSLSLSLSLTLSLSLCRRAEPHTHTQGIFFQIGDGTESSTDSLAANMDVECIDIADDDVVDVDDDVGDATKVIAIVRPTVEDEASPKLDLDVVRRSLAEFVASLGKSAVLEALQSLPENAQVKNLI